MELDRDKKVTVEDFLFYVNQQRSKKQQEVLPVRNNFDRHKTKETSGQRGVGWLVWVMICLSLIISCAVLLEVQEVSQRLEVLETIGK